jgi:hypothetical protein
MYSGEKRHSPRLNTSTLSRPDYKYGNHLIGKSIYFAEHSLNTGRHNSTNSQRHLANTRQYSPLEYNRLLRSLLTQCLAASLLFRS